jgi:uncharacterized protein YegP (UPF0339 family)
MFSEMSLVRIVAILFLLAWLFIGVNSRIKNDAFQTSNQKETIMARPKFLIKKSKNDMFYFNLTAKNGQVIATSEMFPTVDATKRGIEAVKKYAPDAPIEEDFETEE